MMPKAKPLTLEQRLEAEVTRYNLEAVLDALTCVCYDHARTQTVPQSKADWRSVARAIQVATAEASNMRI